MARQPIQVEGIVFRKPIKVEGIVFRKEDRQVEFLLLKRTAKRGGFWQPVTGGVEEGETISEALKREVNEETKISNFIQILEKVHYFELESGSIRRVKSKDKIKEYVYGVEVSEDQTVEICPEEHTEFKWCSYEDALGLLRWDTNKTALKKLHDRIKII
jgi:dihydroneopterin triphosphate diphosphatase